ncbi:MAG: archaellin/type IV pilin N-terminal domain-containing protein [Candidatus Bathyarchaeia archaeon]
MPIQAQKNMRKNNRAISPAISTVIMTAAIVVLVLVAMTYANGSLTNQIAGDEFTANKQFMQSTGLQIDNVAWTIGRTETVDYTANYGQVTFVPKVIDYTFEIYNGISWKTIYSSTTGMILFNMPIRDYTLGNNYFSRIIPASSGSFLQWNASASVCQVFATQKAPMQDGSYARIVAVPTVRVLNSALVTRMSYYTFYLPCLVSGLSPYLSQSVTLTGSSLTNLTPSGAITQVRIDATAVSNSPTGFNNAFFNFDNTSETIIIPSGASIEFYIGTVEVSIGMGS